MFHFTPITDLLQFIHFTIHYSGGGALLVVRKIVYERERETARVSFVARETSSEYRSLLDVYACVCVCIVSVLLL